MKCECGKEISIWDVILPWRKSYIVCVVDDDGSTIEKIRICEGCYQGYEILMKAIGELGLEEVLKIMDEVEEETK